MWVNPPLLQFKIHHRGISKSLWWLTHHKSPLKYMSDLFLKKPSFLAMTYCVYVYFDHCDMGTSPKTKAFSLLNAALDTPNMNISLLVSETPWSAGEKQNVSGTELFHFIFKSAICDLLLVPPVTLIFPLTHKLVKLVKQVWLNLFFKDKWKSLSRLESVNRPMLWLGHKLTSLFLHSVLRCHSCIDTNCCYCVKFPLIISWLLLDSGQEKDF